MTDNQNAPRVTKDEMEAQIAKIQYLNMGDASEAAGGPSDNNLKRLTICIITLHSGFTVTGESACVSPANYNKELGEKYAYEAAFNKLWPLFGFHLKQKLHEDGMDIEEVDMEKLHLIAARTAHGVNNEIRKFKNPDEPVVSWADAPADQRLSAMAGVEALMLNPHLTPEGQHEQWYEFKKAQGWTYGPVKDDAAKTHPCMVKYSQLDAADRLKDATFQAVTRGVLGV